MTGTTVTGGTVARVLGNRRLMRMPIALYRAGLGFLFGSRLLMLEHVGRTTGARRYVVLEVVARPARDVYVVASGFGERAQWFRNVTAEPRVHVSVGRRRRRPGAARQLSTAEVAATLGAYARNHPRAWARFRTVLEHTLQAPVSELPLVELRLDGPDAP